LLRAKRGFACKGGVLKLMAQASEPAFKGRWAKAQIYAITVQNPERAFTFV